MLIAALCLQASFLAHPLYLDTEKPRLRSAQNILILHDDLEGLTETYNRDHDAALALAKSLHSQLEAGADFLLLARQHSNSRTALGDSSLGSYPPGMLAEPVNSWLFAAELGELSGVLDSPRGIHILRRIETHAGVLMIQLARPDADSQELAQSIIEQLSGGAEFADLAREHSVERESAERGGAYRVFERGSHDVLLKAAAFHAEQGQVTGPLATPLGLYILKRVAPDSLPKELWEDNFIRIRAVVISHVMALGADPLRPRTIQEALKMAQDVVRRVNEGEDFAEIAGRFNDDPGGKARRGDVGWVYRHNPDLPPFLQQLYLKPAGTMLEPIQTPAGYIIVRREE